MNRYKVITVAEAKELLKKEGSILLDIRDKENFDEWHVENAYHMNQDNLPLFAAGTPKETLLVVMSYQGNSSQNIAQYLIVHGFKDVYSVENGVEEWQEDI